MFSPACFPALPDSPLDRRVLRDEGAALVLRDAGEESVDAMVGLSQRQAAAAQIAVAGCDLSD